MADSRTARDLNELKLLLYQSIKSNEELNKRIDALQKEKEMLNDRVNEGRSGADLDLDPLKLDLLKLNQVRDGILVRQQATTQQVDRLKDLIERVKKDVDKFYSHVENLQAKCDKVNCSISEEKSRRQRMLAEIESVRLRSEKMRKRFDRTELNSQIAREKSLRDAQLRSNEELKNVQIQLFNDQLLQEQRLTNLKEVIAETRSRALECEQARKTMFQQWREEQHEWYRTNSTRL